MKFKLDPDGGTPLYIQLRDELFIRIINKEFPLNTSIPSIPELMEDYNVGRITVRKAIKELIDNGIVNIVKGKGTYVIKNKVSDLESTGEGYTASITRMKHEPSTKLISVFETKVNEEIGKILGLEKGSVVWCIKRLRLIDRMPYIFEIDYIDRKYDFIKDYKNENQSLYQLFRDNGFDIYSTLNVVDIGILDREMSEHLRMEENAQVVKINEIDYTQNNKVLYYNENYYNNNVGKFSFKVNLREEEENE